MPTPPPTALRTDVRCRRCARIQPSLPPGVFHCLYCGTPLPLQRWVAHPPPGPQPSDRPPARKVRRVRYAGPPRYRPAPPRWGFPPTGWRPAEPTDPDAGVQAPIGALRVAAAAAFLTAGLCAVAAAGEIWRFRLMLQGRTMVLDGNRLAVSDRLLVLASWLALLAAFVTALLATPAIVRAHRAAAATAGRSVTRRPIDVWLRLLVPLWNSYGAGQVLTETEALLAHRESRAGSPQTSVLIRWWWLSWLISSALTIVTLVRGLGGSVQAIADTVELHIAVDAAAALVTLLGGLVLLRLARLFAGPRRNRWAGWTVAPPALTRPRLDDPVAARRRSGVVPPTAKEMVTIRAAAPGSDSPVQTAPDDAYPAVPDHADQDGPATGPAGTDTEH
jgi:hypothetical protein